MGQIKKAVFPVAGLGTRFLPATKANPKEMLPIVDKPLIQYAVEEAIHAGMNHMILITSSCKRAIEDHFDTQFELEARLLERSQTALLALVQKIAPPHIQFTYIRQHRPLGLGDALLCAQAVVGTDPFAVLLADDLIDEQSSPCLEAMIEVFTQEQQAIIAVQPVESSCVNQYGIVETSPISEFYGQIQSMVEKPSIGQVTSNLAAVGRYLFKSSIFEHLKDLLPDKRGEIQLTDGISSLLKKEPVLAYTFCGKRYDCGSKLGYLQAMVELGMRHPEVGAAFTSYLKGTVG